MFSQYPYRAVCIYVIATLFLLYEMALQVSPSVMTDELMAAFDMGAGKLGLMAAFYFYSYTLMQIPAGLFNDRFGPKRALTISAILCALGAYFFAGTQTFAMASLGRFLMGLGSSSAYICVLVVASRWFKKSAFTMLAGIGMFLAAMGALSGGLTLALIIDSIGWRTSMLVMGIAGLGVALIALLFVRDYPPNANVRHEADRHLRLRKKLHEILTHGQTYAIAAYAFCSWAPVAVFAALWGVPFVSELYSLDSAGAAFAIGMIWLGVGLAAPFFGWLSDKMGVRNVPLQVTAMIGIIASILIIYVPIPLWLMYIALFCLGIAGSGQIVTFGIIQDINRPSMVGAAIGFNNMALVSGGALLQPLIGGLLTLFWSGSMRLGIPYYSVSDYKMSLTIVPLCFIVGWILSRFVIEETYCQHKGRA